MESQTLLRLCHICKKINESEGEILKCDQCGKGFLPMHYFEKIRLRAKLATENLEEIPRIALNPINGLIVFW